MIRDEVRADYFDWLCNSVCYDRYSEKISYRKLLAYLHDTVFSYSVLGDKNRVGDGVGLRYRFARTLGYEDLSDYLYGPCSVLEMMIALAVRCEEHIMDDPELGDRTGQWFWGMIVSLGLGSMNDDQFEHLYVEDIVNRFLDREYEPNGRGGLFTIKRCDYDLRNVEIWYQLCYYLNSNI